MSHIHWAVVLIENERVVVSRGGSTHVGHAGTGLKSSGNQAFGMGGCTQWLQHPWVIHSVTKNYRTISWLGGRDAWSQRDRGRIWIISRDAPEGGGL